MSHTVRQVVSLVVIAAVAGAACTARTGHRTSAAASPSPHTAGASCPATVPTDTAAVPPVVARAGGEWYGKDDLWVSLWFARPDSATFANRGDGSYHLKYGSVTLDDGGLTSRFGPPEVHATRLDGSGSATVDFGGYGSTESLRFWPTGIDFPEPGCWQVTSSHRKTVVRFVVTVL